MPLTTLPRRVTPAEDLAGFTAAQLTDVLAAFTTILALPRAAVDRVDALVVPVGQGEEGRLRHAIRRWETNRDIGHLLVANGNPAEETYTEITLDYLRGLGLRRLDRVHLQAEPAPNTGLQAGWIAEQVDVLGLASLGLSVSAYHLPRVYLTVLKALGRRGVRVALVPDPTPVPPGSAVPETGASAYDLLPGEAVRILSYQQRGWVATLDELRQYLHWLWSERQSLLVEPPT
ncbi:hypothetical protein O7626_07180 [Micromonospora sp. WMMD1102]|uniref:hypothetical protein n=1 Tax=Micromonospora sp. WMMD1102 TaxID=3016105 RepID=UPI002414D422|nr:hypothetical protein [Micromonospora sp. WMMD1102]MDG4785715.1 hypothetical protein [Micromonospora sp. WMMD1102]